MVVERVADLDELDRAPRGEELAHVAGRVGARLRDPVDLDAVARRDQQRLGDRQLAGERPQRRRELVLAERELLAHVYLRRAPADPDDEQLAHPHDPADR